MWKIQEKMRSHSHMEWLLGVMKKTVADCQTYSRTVIDAEAAGRVWLAAVTVICPVLVGRSTSSAAVIEPALRSGKSLFRDRVI